jgi:hypothetical protein
MTDGLNNVSVERPNVRPRCQNSSSMLGDNFDMLRDPIADVLMDLIYLAIR